MHINESFPIDPLPSPASLVAWNLIRFLSLVANGFLLVTSAAMVGYVAIATIDSESVYVGSVGATFGAYVITGLLVSLVAAASTLALWLLNKREAVRRFVHLLLLRSTAIFVLAAIVTCIIVELRLPIK